MSDNPLPIRKTVTTQTFVNSKLSPAKVNVTKKTPTRVPKRQPQKTRNLRVRQAPPKRKNSRLRPSRTMANYSSPYLNSRLQPYVHSHPKTGIPDGTSTPTALVKHRLTTTFTMGTSNRISIVIAPILPRPMWFKFYDTDTLADGVRFTQAAIDNGEQYGTFCLPEWGSMSLTRNNKKNQIDELQSLYNSPSFRIVSLGWSITYVGNLLVSAGTCIINSHKLSLNTAIPNLPDFTVSNIGVNGDTVYGEGNVWVRQVAVMPRFAYTTDETAIIPLADHVHGLNRRSDSSFVFKPINTNQTYVTTVNQDSRSMLLCRDNLPSTINLTGIIAGIDDSWDSTLIDVTGGQSGSTFILDVSMIVEYTIPSSSTVSSLVQNKQPSNEVLLKLAESRAGKLAIAYSGSPISTVDPLRKRLTKRII